MSKRKSKFQLRPQFVKKDRPAKPVPKKSLYDQLKTLSQRPANVTEVKCPYFPTEAVELRQMMDKYGESFRPRLRMECFRRWHAIYGIHFDLEEFRQKLSTRLKVQCDWSGDEFDHLPPESQQRLRSITRSSKWAASCVDEKIPKQLMATDLKQRVLEAYGTVAKESKLDFIFSAMCELFVLASCGFNRMRAPSPSLLTCTGYHLSNAPDVHYEHRFAAEKAAATAGVTIVHMHVPHTEPESSDRFVNELPRLQEHGIDSWVAMIATLPLMNSFAILSSFLICHESWHSFIFQLIEYCMLCSVNMPPPSSFLFHFKPSALSDPYVWYTAFS